MMCYSGSGLSKGGGGATTQGGVSTVGACVICCCTVAVGGVRWILAQVVAVTSFQQVCC